MLESGIQKDMAPSGYFLLDPNDTDCSLMGFPNIVADINITSVTKNPTTSKRASASNLECTVLPEDVEMNFELEV